MRSLPHCLAARRLIPLHQQPLEQRQQAMGSYWRLCLGLQHHTKPLPQQRTRIHFLHLPYFKKAMKSKSRPRPSLSRPIGRVLNKRPPSLSRPIGRVLSKRPPSLSRPIDRVHNKRLQNQRRPIDRVHNRRGQCPRNLFGRASKLPLRFQSNNIVKVLNTLTNNQ